MGKNGNVLRYKLEKGTYDILIKKNSSNIMSRVAWLFRKYLQFNVDIVRVHYSTPPYKKSVEFIGCFDIEMISSPQNNQTKYRVLK